MRDSLTVQYIPTYILPPNTYPAYIYLYIYIKKTNFNVTAVNIKKLPIFSYIWVLYYSYMKCVTLLNYSYV